MYCCNCGKELPDNIEVCFHCGYEQYPEYIVNFEGKKIDCETIFTGNQSKKEINRNLKMRGIKDKKRFLDTYTLPYYRYALHKKGLLQGEDKIVINGGLLSYKYLEEYFGGMKKMDKALGDTNNLPMVHALMKSGAVVPEKTGKGKVIFIISLLVVMVVIFIVINLF